MLIKINTIKLSVTLLIIACAIPTAVNDLYLPSMLSLTTHFGLSEKIVQLSFITYLWASVLGSLVSWKLTKDRRRFFALFLGLVIFLVSTGMCATSKHTESLFISRWLLGFGASLLGIVGWAIINDLYNLEENAKSMSWLGFGISIIPLIAPIVGGTVTQYYGWQVNFLILFVPMVIITLILFLLLKKDMLFREVTNNKTPESNKITECNQIAECNKTIEGSIISMKIMLKNPLFLINASIFPLLAANEWCWLTVLPFYFKTTFHSSPQLFGCYLSLIAAGATLGTFLAQKIIDSKNLDIMINLGIKIHILGILLQIITCHLKPNSPVCIALAFFTCLIGTSLVFGPSSSKTLQLFPDLKGTASFLRNAIILLAAALGGTIGTLLPTTYLLALCIIMLGTSVSSYLLFASSKKHTLEHDELLNRSFW